MLLEAALICCGAACGCATVGPQIAAAFMVRVIRQVLADEALRADVRLATADSARHIAAADELLADVVWSKAMRDGLAKAMVEMMRTEDFREELIQVVSSVTKDRTLKDTIREGVVEALRDVHLKEQVKALVIEGMQDADLQKEFTKSAIAIVKTGIKESLEDTELKDVIAQAVLTSLQDPRLAGMLKDVLKDALSDEDIHRAMRTGAVTALNPFRGAMTTTTLRPSASSVISATTPEPNGPEPVLCKFQDLLPDLGGHSARPKAKTPDPHETCL